MRCLESVDYEGYDETHDQCDDASVGMFVGIAGACVDMHEIWNERPLASQAAMRSQSLVHMCTPAESTAVTD